MLNRAVADYLQSNRDRHLAKLLELLRIPSIANVHDEPDSCVQAAQWLVRHLAGLGLEARLAPVEGHKPNVLAEARVSPGAPTVLVYGHYDVQPAQPLDLWTTPPFEPAVRDGCIYARGANDDKGQVFAQLMAVEAWQRAGGGLPVNLKVFLEGEEEIGSPSMEDFLSQNAAALAADAAVISDGVLFAAGVPSLTYALRGVAYFEVTFTGPNADLHSGLHGGAVTNPINALARLVAAMHDDNGRVTIPGFYDDVLELTERERAAWRKLPMNDAEYAASLGVKELGGGERGYSVLERRWGRPTLDCNGITGGYAGPGSKTIIPSRASTKITVRLVSHQNPARIAEAFRRFVAAHTPPGIASTVTGDSQVRPVLLPTDSPAMRAAQGALAEAFGHEPVFIRCGASIPVTELFQRLLGINVVLLDMGLPDDGLHAPNEHFHLDNLYRGSRAAALFLQNFAALART